MRLTNVMFCSSGVCSTQKALTAYFIYRVREIVNAWPHRSTAIDITSVSEDLSEHERDILQYMWTSCEQFIRSHKTDFQFDSAKQTVDIIEKDDGTPPIASVADLARTAAEVLPPQSFIPMQCLSVHLDELSQKKIQAHLVENPTFAEKYAFHRIQCYCVPNSTRKSEGNVDGTSGANRVRQGKATEQIFIVNRKWQEECGKNFPTYSTMMASFFCSGLKEEFLRYGLPSYWVPLSETLKTAHRTIQKIVTFIGLKRFALLFDRDTEAQVALLGTQNRAWVRNISGLQEKDIPSSDQTKAGDASQVGEPRSQADLLYSREYEPSLLELTLLALSLPCQRSISVVRAMNYPSVKEMYRRLKLPEIMVTFMFPSIFSGEQNNPSLSSSLILSSALSPNVRRYFSVRLTNVSDTEEERIRKLLYAEEFTAERTKLFESFRHPDAMNGLGIKILPNKSIMSPKQAYNVPITTKTVLQYAQKHLGEFEIIPYRDLMTRIMNDISAENKESFRKAIRLTHHNFLALLGDYPDLFRVEEKSETINQRTVYYHTVSRGGGKRPSTAPVMSSRVGKARWPSLNDEENPYHDSKKLLKLLIQIRGERAGEISQGNFLGLLPVGAKQVIRQVGGLDKVMRQFQEYFQCIEKETYGGKKMPFYSLTPHGRNFYNEIIHKPFGHGT